MRCLSSILLTAVTAALAACGGDSNLEPAPGTPQRPLVATTQAPAVKSTGAQRAAGSSGRSNEAAAGPKGKTASGTSETGTPAQKPNYKALVEQQKPKQGQRFTPCNLVPEARAAAILGGPIQQPLEAPQGPTCIYRSRSGKGFVTVAVQTLNFKKIKPQVRSPHRFVLAGRAAYCGSYGQPMLYVPLAGGRVLSIAGPCEVARAFAVTAVQRLPS